MAPGLMAILLALGLGSSPDFRAGIGGRRLVTSGVLWGFGALYAKIRHREGLGFAT